MGSSTRLTQLRTENATEPAALWTPRPRFLWVLAGPDDLTQVAYEIEVTTGAGHRVAVSGRVESTDSVLVPCLNADLESRTGYCWRVRAWTTAASQPTPWAETRFETADFGPWDAPWVEPDQDTALIEGPTSIAEAMTSTTSATDPSERLHPVIRLRHRFTLDRSPVRGRLRATAQGVYQPYLNGVVVGDQVLAPGL